LNARNTRETCSMLIIDQTRYWVSSQWLVETKHLVYKWRRWNKTVGVVQKTSVIDKLSSKQQTKNKSKYPNVTSLCFATPLVFNAPMEGFPCDDLRKILHVKGWLWRKMAKEYCRKFQPPE